MTTFIRVMDAWSNAVVLTLLTVSGNLPAAYLCGEVDELVKWATLETK